MDRIIKVKKPKTNLFKDKWIWKIAWRDTKNNRIRLFLYVGSMLFGIAALVAVNAFNDNLWKDIDNQARAFLAADLVLYANESFDTLNEAYFDSLNNTQAEDARLSSMITFPEADVSRLAKVTGIKGPYPLYGPFSTFPSTSLEQFRNGGHALIDENLAMQHKIDLGDSVKVGTLTLPIIGFVTKIPGNVNISATFAPSVYIPLDSLQSTGLIQAGSQIHFRKFFKHLPDQKEKDLLIGVKPAIREYNVSWESVSYRKENLSKGFEQIFRFLNLMGFMALIIGSIGAASSVVIYLKEKTGTIATLRCLGISAHEGYLIFLIQSIVLGLIGSIFGTVLGLYLQQLIPLLLQDFIPTSFSFGFSWKAVFLGISTGLVSTFLFSFFPLKKLKHTTPTEALRSKSTITQDKKQYHWPILIAIFGFLLLLAVVQSGSIWIALSFIGGVLITCLALVFVAQLLISTVRWLLSYKPNFVWKQGLSNLFRVNNQTFVLIIVIGVSTLLITTLQQTHFNLIKQVDLIGSQNKTDLVLFGVEPTQASLVDSLIVGHKINNHKKIPIVTVRLERIQNKSLNTLKSDPDHPVPAWLLYQEHLITYRNTLLPTEKIIEGKFTTDVNRGDSIFISITNTMADQLNVGVKDVIEFNVHGLMVKTFVGSIRKMDWQKIQNSFMFVFPEGVLEKAPQQYAYLLGTPHSITSTTFQIELTEKAPNISALDLKLALGTLNNVIDKTSFVLNFMMAFCLLTSLTVLIGAVLNSQQSRIRENILLKTIGARQKVIHQIFCLEYLFIGFFAASSGVILSIAASWLLTFYFFDLNYYLDYVTLFLLVGLIMLATLFVGWLHNRLLLNKSAMEILRLQA